MKRYATITRTLEDGTLEETLIELPNRDSKKQTTKNKSSRKQSNEDNKKQEEEQATSTSKATVSIKRTES